MALYEMVYKTAGNVYYFRLIKKANGHVWNESAQEFQADTNRADSKVAMVEAPTGSGSFQVVIPDTLSRGKYDIVVYEQTGGSPADSDSIAAGFDDIEIAPGFVPVSPFNYSTGRRI